MKNRALVELLQAFTVILPSGLGLFVVARTLANYWGRDSVASAIVAAMGVALACGAVELVLRQRRASQLERELGALPATPSEATLDAASPVLSSLLRARVEGAAPPSLGESIAPSLTGLLVMLGLLGTLLGLFETVSGASHALATSTDVDALRTSLTTPIAGLTRSFGCSAAGISASAMLGLALALVRRREGRMLRVFHSYASGPLRVLSPARRQTRALEQLASQGLALPEASTALAQVGTQLGELSTRLLESQQAALGAQQQALSELLRELRAQLAQVAADAGAALHERVAPLVQDAIARTGQTLQAQAETLAESARQVAGELSRNVDRASERAGALADALTTQLAEAEQERAEAQRAQLAQLTELASSTVVRAEQREQALAARWNELSMTLESRWASLAGAVEQSSAAQREQESERNARLEGLSARIGGDLDRLSAQLGEQLTRRLANESAHDARARDGMAALQRGAEAMEASVARQEHTLEQLVERLPALMEASVARQEHTLEQLVERLPPLLHEVAEAAQSSAQAGLEQLTQSADARFQHISELLTTDLEARRAKEVAGEQQMRGALANIEQAGALLESGIAHQKSLVDQLIQRVGAQFEELSEAAQLGAHNTLQRLSESADEQAARFTRLESSLTHARSEHAQSLAAKLSEHAEQLEQRLSSASQVVQEAATLWKVSSIEMQAVAELFAKSVDRQREASDAWLESLGEIEGAVDRAGRHAAADALSDQLASTQEVFARQLQFQRELFEQLRTLRAAARNGHGEHDVSV